MASEEEFNPSPDAMNRILLFARVVDTMNGQHLGEFTLRMPREDYFKDRLLAVRSAYAKYIEGER